MGSYPSQMMTANMWANGDSKVDHVSQWPLEGHTQDLRPGVSLLRGCSLLPHVWATPPIEKQT